MSEEQETPKEEEQESPKIVVDEDWKSQAHQAKQKASEPKASQAEEVRLPPVSMEGLVSLFATQAVTAMGAIADPETGQAVVQKPIAKHFIDLLGLLEEKTKGNLTTEESNLLTETLHQLRMLYVAAPDKAPQPPPEKPNIIT